MEKDTKDLLQHLLNYWDIYNFVAADKKSIPEIRSFLVEEKQMSDTTMRRYISTITKDVPGMFIVSKNDICINKELLSDVIGEVMKNLQIASNEISKVAMADKDKQITSLNEKIQKVNSELESVSEELEVAHQTIIQREQLIEHWECKNKQLVQNHIGQQLDTKVVFVGDMVIKPEPDIEDAMFLDDSVVKLDIEKSISKHGGERDSFFIVKENEDEHTITNENYFRRIADKIMSAEFFEKWAKEIAEERKFNEKHGIVKKESAALVKDRDSSYEKKSEVERHADKLFRRRKLAIQTIMNDDRLTDQMKLQMYARFGEYHGTEMERLINFAADYGLNAKWFIQVLEDSGSMDSYENIRDYLRMFAKPSEYRKKMDFARELLDGVWDIKLDYDGKPTRFALVPVREINEIRERLLLPPSEFTSKDFDEVVELPECGKNNKPVSEGKQTEVKKTKQQDAQSQSLDMIEKPDFVSTYSFKEDELDQDAEKFGLDEDTIDYGEYEEMECV